MKLDLPFFSDDVDVQSFQTAQRQNFIAQGLPTRAQDNWKYTDVSFLKDLPLHAPVAVNPDLANFIQTKKVANENLINIVVIDGTLSQKFSDLHLLPANIILTTLKQAVIEYPEKAKAFLMHHFDGQKYPFAVFNSATLQDGLFCYLPCDTQLSQPLHFIYITTQSDCLFSLRNIVIADQRAQATVIEEYCDVVNNHNLTNVVTEIHVEKQAQIQYHKLTRHAGQHQHFANIFISQARESTVAFYSLTKQSALHREEVIVNLQGEYAHATVNGFYHTHYDKQHVDHQIQINHIVPLGTSKMLYKGVLEKPSKAIFNGKIYVHPEAQKSSSLQANHNLVLDKNAEVYTQPQFEIYADDVKCAHGATVGQLNAEALFFLRARGINKFEAMKLLTHAFANDVFETIKNPNILKHFQQAALETDHVG